MNKAATILPNIKIYAIRLLPGEDLINALQDLATTQEINAGWIMSAVGSFTKFSIRFADQPQPVTGSGHFEMVGLTGVISNRGCHLHIIIADENGLLKGGHLSQGCIIYTTAEIIVGYTDKYTFDRIKDGSTPWQELLIEENNTH